MSGSAWFGCAALRRGFAQSTLRARGVGLWGCMLAAGCSSEVPLGSWLQHTSDGNTGGVQSNQGGQAGHGQAGDAQGGGGNGGNAVDRLCGEEGEFTSLNTPGNSAIFNVTLTYTDWIWPAVHDSMEWDLEVESEFTEDAYFWTHQFGFVGGPVGFLGLQARGSYQADANGPIETTNMVVFWISTPTFSPARAELADIPDPDARIATMEAQGGWWWTINARYPFRPCRTYRLSVTREEEEADNVWYAARVTDTEAASEKLIGRILVPVSWGRLSTTSSMWTNRLGYSRMKSCGDAEPASARFGFPTANGGALRASSHVNRFVSPSCASSRFSELPNGVRHQLAVPEL